MTSDSNKTLLPGVARSKAPFLLEKIVQHIHNKSHISNFIEMTPHYVYFHGPFIFGRSLPVKYDDIIEILIKELYTPYPENIFEEAYRHIFPLPKKYVVIEVVMLDLHNNEINMTVSINSHIIYALKVLKDIQPLLKCEIYQISQNSKTKVNSVLFN